MKRILATILLLLVAVSLLGCGATSGGASASGSSAASAQSAASGAESAAPSDSSTGTEADARRLAFGKVLWDAYQKGVLPDGDPLDYSGMDAANLNSFAVMDVDGDGQEELVLFWGNACMAGMVGIVFGYADGAVYEELTEFPALTFYDNGIAVAAWSHNQGLAGDFWPYNVYRYDAESGVYQPYGSVDAWDKSLTDVNSEGEPFPDDIDADGDGLVYFLLPADWQGYYDNAETVDGAAYEDWRNAYLDGAQELTVSDQSLTEEHIAALGYPKPDVPVPEAKG
jgi:predicted small secreted protein